MQEKISRNAVGARHISISAAIFVLICFFLPWVQVSCGGLKDSASGFDLARDGDGALWLVPFFMLAVILIGLTRLWRSIPTIFALLGVVGGAFTAYLINRERLDVDRVAVVSAHTTGWLWLAFFSSIALALSAFVFFLKRGKSP